MIQDTDLGSLFHLSHHCRIEITGWLTKPGEMKPQHFGSDPADIRIQINRDLNPGSVLVEILVLAEVCAVWAQSSFSVDLRTSHSRSVMLFSYVIVQCCDGFRTETENCGFIAEPNQNRNRGFLVAMWQFFANFKNGPTRPQMPATIT